MTTSSSQGGTPERERLIESHLPLVRAIARRYAGRGETVEDLIQVGAVALIRASDRFDPARGVPFATFAAPAVEGEIRRHLGDQTGSVRIPRELRRMAGELERLRAQLTASLGRSPTADELAARLGVEPEDIEQALKAGRAREPAPAVSEDVIESANEAESLQSTDDRLLLAAGAHVLDERERRIVVLRFHADMTEREIAREVGISQAQVSRVLAGALAKLREALDESAPTSRGDIAEEIVISVGQRATGPQTGSSSRPKKQASVAHPPTIPPVGALEEQAHLAGAVQASAKEDLALPYHVTVKREGDDRRSDWIASLDELPGCEARGATSEQAVENLRSAMESWLSAAARDPRVIPPSARSGSKPKKASSHSGRFLVRMPSDLHMELTLAAEREQVSLNRFVTTQLEAAVASPGSAAAASAGATGEASASPPALRRKRSFRMLLAANLLVVVLAAGAAIALLVLALERGI